MELIDKDKLLEGLRTIKENLSASPIVVIEDVESLAESLEVKEVDLEKEFYNFLDTLIGKDNGHLSEDELFSIAEYFYELGISAQTSTVWHYVSEEIPTKFGKPVIVASLNKNKEDGIWLYDLIQSWEGEWSPRVNWENPVKWAYMNDLLK